MTLRHIRIFLAVCECGFHTTRAAEALHMTQPAVSLAVRELEEYYGAALFDRINRRLRITEAGKQMRDYAVRITALFDDMEKGLRNWDTFGILRVGASYTIGAHFLPAYVRLFREKHPGTDVRVSVQRSGQLEAQVLRNELDFALIEDETCSPELVSVPYMEDHLTVIASADAGFRPKQALTAEEFSRYPLLLREHGSGTRETLERAAQQTGIQLTPQWEASSNTALINAAASGLGLAVLSRRIVADVLKTGRVVELTVSELPLRRQFRIIYHRDKLLTASAKAFMSVCRESGGAG